MDPKIAKKTQDTLGKYIKKPPLTDKLLGKPPFRFLHDVITSVIKNTGFMNGLFPDAELNSDNVKDRDSKVAFLQKAIDIVVLATGKRLSIKPNKVVAGGEAENTNEFLQALAEAIGKKPDNEALVNKVLGRGKSSDSKEDKRKEEKKDRPKEPEREKSSDRRRRREEGDDDERKEKKEREERHKNRDERRKERDGEKEEKEERHRNREERHKDRERDDRHKERKSRKNRDEDKENDHENINRDGEEEEQQKPQRPTSAKGSRRRRDVPDEDTGKRPSDLDQQGGDENLPPQVAAARKMGRPSSARPAPPRPKHEGLESEPAMRLGSGKPTNLMVDGHDSDEDDTFVVEESAPAPEPQQMTKNEDLDEEDGEHGGLVKKILETKKELESGSQQNQKKTEIVHAPTVPDAQKRKEREQVEKEVNKLKTSIQTLTRNAQPLGRIMDFIQEDLDSMQKELEKWRTENKEHSITLKREGNITDHAIEPLKSQLSDTEQSIKDQLGLIGAVKSNIIRNDQKIEKMLKTIGKS